MIRKHDAVLDDAHVTFTWTVSSGDLDRLDVVERLLKADWAHAVTFQPADVKLAPALREWDRTMTRARGMHELELLLDDDSVRLRSLLTWVRRHRRLTGLVIWLWLVDKFKQRRRNEPADTSGTLRDTASGMKELADEMAERAAELQLPLAVTRYLEREMLRPAYLARVNPTRLRLSSLRTTLVLGGEEQNLWLDPMLTLYGSGVCTVSIDLPLPARMTASALQRCARSSDIELLDLWVPTTLRRTIANEGTWTGEEEDGYHQYLIRGAKDGVATASLTTVWDVILRGLELIPQIRFHDQWQSYPLVAGVLHQCCRSRHTWERRHLLEFERLLLTRPAGLKKGAQLRERPVNSSYDPDVWLWHTAAATLSVRWEDDGTKVRFEDVTRLLIVCEIYLVQTATLRLLSDELVNAVRGPGIKKLRRFAVRLNLSMEEFDHPALSYLSAQEDVERMLQEAGASATQSRLQERTAALSSLIAIGRAERSARRGLRIAAAALVSAVVLSLPALTDGIGDLRRVKADAPVLGTLLAPLRASTMADVTMAVWVIAGTLTLVAVLLGAGRLWTFVCRLGRRLRRPRKLPGHRWSDGTVRVVPRRLDLAPGIEN